MGRKDTDVAMHEIKTKNAGLYVVGSAIEVLDRILNIPLQFFGRRKREATTQPDDITAAILERMDAEPFSIPQTMSLFRDRRVADPVRCLKYFITRHFKTVFQDNKK